MVNDGIGIVEDLDDSVDLEEIEVSEVDIEEVKQYLSEFNEA